jgi:hypothetical protein
MQTYLIIQEVIHSLAHLAARPTTFTFSSPKGKSPGLKKELYVISERAFLFSSVNACGTLRMR